MKFDTNQVTPSVIAAACTLLQPAAPELTPTGLVNALQAFEQTVKCAPAVPLTRREAAKALKVSLMTVSRMIQDGRLEAKHLSTHSVRITAESLNKLLYPEA